MRTERINGLISMRRVFLWVGDVPAHAKSGIMKFEPGAVSSDGRRKAALKARVDDER